MPNFSTRTARLGKRLLVSTLALAAANAANAQSYDAGDPTVVSGSVTFDRIGTPNTETYTINSNTAVLDFIPNDTGPGGPINFQFGGTLAQYLGGLGITDFTVLNRILATDPSRAIQLNGTIISRLQASPTTPGGSVWFYSPGGIVVGSTAVIDVGNLLLAAGDPTGGSGVITTPNQFAINSVPDSNAAIVVQAGAQISASNPGSYIALVAPAITQSGVVNTNGSVAYVAAEQTTLTFNSGLFNIETTVGSNANNNTPLVHNGTTRFIDDTGQRRAYLVSVAKNDAITMLIEGSGQLGFDTATGVNIDNGVVVLSGGYDVNDTAYTNLAGTAGGLRHDIELTNPTNNANFQGQVNPFAASEIRISPVGQAMTFAGNVAMNAGALASVIPGLGGSVDITGDLDLSTLVYGLRDADIFGGNIVLDASLGNISIGGNTSLTSFADADFLGGADPAGTVNGGTIAIIADGGNTVSMLGSLDILVEANGADQLLVSQTSAGDAVGGNIILASSGGSAISVGGVANIASTATGGTVQLGNATAGNATGGTTNIFAVDGDISFGGDLSVSARGNGGQVNASGTTTAGDGTGGQIVITVGSNILSVAGALVADVTGSGGSTQFATSRGGGDGNGGSISMSVVGTGGIDVGTNFLATADGLGSAAVGAGNSGGSGTGGTVQILSQGGTMNFGGNVALNAFGRGEAGSDNTGVVAQGGTLVLQANTGTISIGGNLDMFAQGLAQVAGSGQDGANAVGGSSIASATNSGTLDVIGTAVVSASAVGGNANGGINGQAGDAQGGNAQLAASGAGILTIGQGATASAVGIGGNGLTTGSNGGNGSGGTASFSQDTGGLVLITVPFGQSAVITTDGTGGSSTGGGGIGGNGTGGDSSYLSNDGTVNLNGDLFVSVQGQGGDSDGASGGNGIGGLATVQTDTGLARVTGNTTIRSAGLGGAGLGTGSNGGFGTGGQSLIGSIDTGAIDLLGTVTFNDNSSGGSTVSGVGGNGTAGLSRIFATAGTVDIGGFVNFNTNGTGGGGLNGGIGTGGRASVVADTTGTINFTNQVQMTTRGLGGRSEGAGNSGGFGQGGTAEIFARGTINIVGDYFANSGGIGGQGANGADGGDGLGGVGSIIADGGVIRFDGGARTRGTTNGGSVISGNGSGGDAQAGLAEMIARNGGNIEIFGVSGSSDANVSATALSGGGLFGSSSSGNAIGGTANVIAESGGTITIAGDLLVTASGLAPDFFDPSSQYADLGGNGTGGTVNILANGGNIIGTSSVAALANGQGGLGVVQGGTGTGGTVNVIAIEGLLDFSSGTDEMFLSMSGFGGDAVAETDGAGNILRGGGNGGDGIGGSIFLLSGLFGNSDGLTGTLRMGDLRVSENAATPLGLSGIGGAGAAGAAGQNGGDGGDGVAGVVRIGTNNGLSQFIAGNINAGNRAIGGVGGDGQNGGHGGDAVGRQTSIGTFNQLGTNTGGSMTVGDVAVNGSALAGNGGAGLNGAGGIGGDALVGAPELFTTLASAFLIGYSTPFTFNDATLTMDSTGGDGGIGTSGRAAGGVSAGFGAGIVSRQATDGVGGNGDVFGNNLIAQAISTGGLGAGDVRAASNLGFVALTGTNGNILVNNVTITDGGLAPNQDDIASYIRSGNGFVEVTGLLDVNTSGDFGIFGLAGGDLEIGNLDVTAGGTILFDDPRAPGSTIGDIITINNSAIAVLDGDFAIGEDIIVGGVFDLTAAGSITTLGITAGAGITLQSGSSITTGNLLSAGNISLTGLADEIAGLPASIVTGNIANQAGSINVVTNIGDITLGNLTSPNAITINAGNGSTNANAGGDIVIGTVQGSDLSVAGTDNLTLGNTNVATSLTLNLLGSINSGSLSAGNNIVISAFNTVTTTGAVTAANFTATSGADLIFGGAITASQQATLSAAVLASFGGVVSAPLITVTSADIAIGNNGGLGSSNTDDLEINAAASGQPIIFGGDGSGGGYNLNATEATKIRSRTIRFNALQLSSGAPADITIRDFTMQGSLAGSSANLLASDLFINSPGNIRVTGAVRIENAGVEDGLYLNAESGRIEVVTDVGGSIAMVNGAGGLGGNLYLDARNIAVGTAGLLGRLADDPRFAGRDAEVNAPDGSNRPEGYISANRIQADGFETIIIQNSGTDALRGGFSAGTGGFVLDSENMTTGAVDAVINGRVANASGGFLTNNDTASGVTFESAADATLFSAGSTTNGCLLTGGGCPTGTTPSTPVDDNKTIASDVRGLVHEQSADEPDEDEEERAAELTPGATSKKSPIAPNIPVVNTGRLDSSPAVNDPITGSGNPNLIGGQLEIDVDPAPGSTNDGDS